MSVRVKVRKSNRDKHGLVERESWEVEEVRDVALSMCVCLGWSEPRDHVSGTQLLLRGQSSNTRRRRLLMEAVRASVCWGGRRGHTCERARVCCKVAELFQSERMKAA